MEKWKDSYCDLIMYWKKMLHDIFKSILYSKYFFKWFFMVTHLTASKNEIYVIYLMASFYFIRILVYSFLR